MTDYATAEAKVRALHSHYTDAVWRKDPDAFARCFTEDGEWRISGNILRGRETIRTMIADVFANRRRILMTFRTPILEVGNGVASGRTYVTEQVVRNTGKSFLAIGCYFERFVEQGDRWLFKWRLFLPYYYGPHDMSGPFFEQPDYGAPLAMPDLDADTVDVIFGQAAQLDAD
jgi:hypothetical protein